MLERDEGQGTAAEEGGTLTSLPQECPILDQAVPSQPGSQAAPSWTRAATLQPMC